MPKRTLVLLLALLSTTALTLGAQTGGARMTLSESFEPQPGIARATPAAPRSDEKDSLDQELTAQLQHLGFTGNIEATLEGRLGSPIDPGRADSRAFYNLGCGGREYQPGQIKSLTMSAS